MPTPPAEWHALLNSDAFVDDAMVKFDALDVDGSGSLSPDEVSGDVSHKDLVS